MTNVVDLMSNISLPRVDIQTKHIKYSAKFNMTNGIKFRKLSMADIIIDKIGKDQIPSIHEKGVNTAKKIHHKVFREIEHKMVQSQTQITPKPLSNRIKSPFAIINTPKETLPYNSEKKINKPPIMKFHTNLSEKKIKPTPKKQMEVFFKLKDKVRLKNIMQESNSEESLKKYLKYKMNREEKSSLFKSININNYATNVHKFDNNRFKIEIPESPLMPPPKSDRNRFLVNLSCPKKRNITGNEENEDRGTDRNEKENIPGTIQQYNYLKSIRAPDFSKQLDRDPKKSQTKNASSEVLEPNLFLLEHQMNTTLLKNYEDTTYSKFEFVGEPYTGKNLVKLDRRIKIFNKEMMQTGLLNKARK